MPTGKNAQLRFQILDRCFSDYTRRYTFEDLLEEVNVKLYDLTGKETSVRTLRDDIKYMKDRMTFNAPIKAYAYDGRKSYYRYTDRNFSIFKNDLSVDEVEKLSAVVGILDRFRGNPDYTWIEEVINDLECRFGLKANTESLISFQKNEQLKGLEYLSEIIDATIYHQTLEVTYLTFKGKEYVYIFHPYYVKQFNNRWFLFGRIDGNDRITNLALDRFVSILKSEVPFVENKSTDFLTYFDDIIGVTKHEDKVPEQVLLKFKESRFPYVVNKPLHKSQKIYDANQHIIELNVRYNQELTAQILYYGSDVEVISPAWLRQQIIDEIKENMKNYFPVQ